MRCASVLISKLDATVEQAFGASKPGSLPMLRTRKNSAANVPCRRLLTARETEILELLGKGLSVKGAARDLTISPGTVKWHAKNIYEKLGVTSREDALRKARLRQLIQ